jgi:hypothetical protein
MKRTCILTFFIYISILGISAQKEVYFADKIRDSISISSLKGVSASISTGDVQTISSLTFQYFNELKLNGTTSLTLGAGIINSVYIKSISYPDGGYYYSSPVIEYGYGIQFNVFAEPRWYFTYKNRYLKGAKTTLNSGWFIGLPLELNTSVLNSDKPFNPHLLVAPTIGYRYALSNKLFIEGQLGCGFNNFLGSYYSFGVMPYLKIKAAYIF